jgi:hypothetical protein
MVPRSSRLVPITALVFALMVCGLVTSQEQNSGPNQNADDVFTVNFYDLKGNQPGKKEFPTTFGNGTINTVTIRAFRLNKQIDETVTLKNLLRNLPLDPGREEVPLLKYNPQDTDQDQNVPNGKGLKTNAAKNFFKFKIPGDTIKGDQERAMHLVLTRLDVGEATAIISFIELVRKNHDLNIAVPAKQPDQVPQHDCVPSFCPCMDYFPQCIPIRLRHRR